MLKFVSLLGIGKTNRANLSLGLTGLGLTSLTESVAETTTDDLQVTHSAGSGGLPPLGLDGPVVYDWERNMIFIREILLKKKK